MRKFLVFEDGHEEELSPLTFGEWAILAEDYWTGSDDTCFDYWLRYHGFRELGDFDGFNRDDCDRKELNSEGKMTRCIIELRDGDVPLKFDLDYSSVKQEYREGIKLK